MNNNFKLYIAGMGVITPVGATVQMTAAAVKAGISAYAETQYHTQSKKTITMASVPDIIFDEIEAEIGEGDRYNARHDRVIKMAIIAIREACSQQDIKQSIPLLMAMPDVPENINDKRLSPLIQNLQHNCKPWINAQQFRSINSGRAAGIEAIDFAFHYLHDQANPFILIGGSDSHRDESRLNPLDDDKRLLTADSMDSFAPGEAAGFLLLTRHPELALQRNDNIIALNAPGVTEEPGHLHSEEIYRGDGLDQAFKIAIKNSEQKNIFSIYSSMNGENHWAKEYGVAYMRSRKFFKDSVNIEHPADTYGDLGSATSSVLIALAAENLFSNKVAQSHLIYSSSDHAKRGAIVIEKIAYKNCNPPINNRS